MQKTISSIFLLALFLLPRTTIAADAAPVIEKPVIEKDVAYLPSDRTEKADLYLPANRAAEVRSPAVVIIHGGGWTSGDKGAAREINIGTTLAQAGYVGMSINYILAAAGRPTWPQNVYDCKTAVRWLRKNAARLQIDPDRIGVIGGSAGGHLSAMLALTGPADGLDPTEPYGEFSCRVQCAVDMYGPADLTSRDNLAMLGKTRESAPDLYRAASPITYIDKLDPPMLLLHGTADKLVEVKQSELLAEKLKQAGVEHELVIIEGAPHTFHLQPAQRDLRPVVLAFFGKYLQAPKK
jgi:acetyl esterase/lipase